jgi:hypothetical protein
LISVLVDGAVLPLVEALPEALKPLALAFHFNDRISYLISRTP